MYRESNVPTHIITQRAAFANWVGSIPISRVPLLVTQDVERDDTRPSLLLYFDIHK